METTIILIICAVVAVLCLVGIFVRKFKTRCACKSEDNAAFGAEILAEVGPSLILRDDQGKIWRTEKKLATDNLGDRILVYPASEKETVGIFPMCYPKYKIAAKGTGLHARVIRRLNEGVLLCEANVQGDRKYLFVACSADEQEKSQTTCSMVVGIKDNGNDRQILKCQDVAELWVEWPGGSENYLSVSVCCRA